MPALSPALLTAAAGAFVGAGTESESSRGRLTELMLRRVGQPNRGRWSAAFVHHIGYWSHYEYEAQFSIWPLPPTNDPADLAAFGEERRICAEDPKVGDVALVWSPGTKSHTRAAIVVRLRKSVRARGTGRSTWICDTIEGDTTEAGAATGGGIHLLERRLSVHRGDRFLRWTALDAREGPSDPTLETTTDAGRLVVARAHELEVGIVPAAASRTSRQRHRPWRGVAAGADGSQDMGGPSRGRTAPEASHHPRLVREVE
jgi:hypothetical protein